MSTAIHAESAETILQGEKVEQPDFKQDALAVREKAQVVKIVGQESYDAAAEVFRATCELEKKIIEHYKPMKESAWTTHKRIVAAEKAFLDPVQEAKGKFSRVIGAWDTAQKQKEEDERRRLEAEERQRQDDLALDEAIAIEAMGAEPEEVAAVLEAPRAAAKVQPQAAYTRSSGVSVPVYYSAELKTTGLLELVKAAAVNPQLLAYLLPNMPAANAAARTQKELFSLPGFTLKKESRAAGRGR